MADDVLRTAGMVEGVTYRKQTGDRRRRRSPTSRFFLPGGRMLHMDVKFPVDNYLRHLEADHRPRAGRRRPRPSCGTCATGSRSCPAASYIDADDTLDEVLLFIPNESVWAFIHEQDPQLLDVAMARRSSSARRSACSPCSP